jgi:hypothetical protein
MRLELIALFELLCASGFIAAQIEILAFKLSPLYLLCFDQIQ